MAAPADDLEQLLGFQQTKQTKPATSKGEDQAQKIPEPDASDVPREKSGLDLFPEHVSGQRYKPGWYDTAIGFGKQDYQQIKCENNIRKVLESSAPVKLLVDAMKSFGCELKLSRNFLCEHCEGYTAGGFDPKNKVIVVCQNNCTTQGKVTSVLAHELIHAFDACRAKVDFDNIEHLACTEIRASAITHCSFLSAMFQGAASPWRYKNQHQECVKIRATESVMNSKGIPLEIALAAVEKVFPKCYKDLEPFGRIPRRNSRDFDKAYYERFYYGYAD
ncbi:mitochondrial inner membrane protease ATP23 homolog [Paramacrobiotus metropolitanus]|uniref:mitochondrial inner membrane protease ATP23 homolog n=1 Tax=Paramacrobiotus metropolitanus TaxID=2943436 RepID=UPI002445F193|nr:mitochondrial inner membrane protease ATP23 homolog [Paramacrobiotus metropolitanus]